MAEKYEPIVEAKVKVSTAVATVAALVLALLSRYVFGGGPVPEFVEAFVESAVTAVVTGGLTFVGGWLANHTPRQVIDVEVTDLPEKS